MRSTVCLQRRSSFSSSRGELTLLSSSQFQNLLGVPEVSTPEIVSLLRAAAFRAAIEKLRTDNEALKEEMQLENKFSVRPTSSSAAATIAMLRQQSDACTQKVLATSQHRTAVQPTPAAMRACPAPSHAGKRTQPLKRPCRAALKAAAWHSCQVKCHCGTSTSPKSHHDCGRVLQIGAERARAADLQQHVAQTQQRVDQQRRQMGGARAAQDCDIQARPS